MGARRDEEAGGGEASDARTSARDRAIQRERGGTGGGRGARLFTGGLQGSQDVRRCHDRMNCGACRALETSGDPARAGQGLRTGS